MPRQKKAKNNKGRKARQRQMDIQRSRPMPGSVLAKIQQTLRDNQDKIVHDDGTEVDTMNNALIGEETMEALKRHHGFNPYDPDLNEPDKRKKGLYAHWDVHKIGDKAGKHLGCDILVLDITHDPHAIPAVFSYARSVGADGFEALEKDLYGKIQPYIKQLNEAAEQEATDSLQADMQQIAKYDELENQELLDKVVNHIWSQMEARSHESCLLEAFMHRFELFQKPIPKRQRKKKDATDTANTQGHAA